MGVQTVGKWSDDTMQDFNLGLVPGGNRGRRGLSDFETTDPRTVPF